MKNAGEPGHASPRRRVAVAGASSFIGAAICEALADRFDIIVLTRSPAKAANKEREGRIQWVLCDLFSRKEIEAALQSVDFAVYLVHNRAPSSRLDQARTQDMDVLVADNFARGAARAGVKQILYRSHIISNAQAMPATERSAGEVLSVLAAHGVPVTTLRTSLVVGPGGEIMQLLLRLVKLLPVVPIPHWARTERRPISLADLMAAVSFCVGNPEVFGGEYDLYGGDAISLEHMLEEAAWALGRTTRVKYVEFLPDWFYVLMLRIARPSLHPDRIAFILEAISSDTIGRDNAVQRAVAPHAGAFRQALKDSLSDTRALTTGDHWHVLREQDDDVIRTMGRVRSIQRVTLPAGKDALWLAEHYFTWLGGIFRPVLTTERDAEGNWSVFTRPGAVKLLHLTFKPGHSSTERFMYFITGGVLFRFLGMKTARLEFRSLLQGSIAFVAIHDFSPALPWYLYRFTQAVVHGFVMRVFQRHMKRLMRSDAG